MLLLCSTSKLDHLILGDLHSWLCLNVESTNGWTQWLDPSLVIDKL